MRIKVQYSEPEANVLEISFYRGEILLHNVFYDISGSNENELIELKKEAISKFGSVFPEIPAKSIMKGFAEVDPLMEELYRQTFNKRNAGRKAGVKIGKIKPETVVFARRVTKEEKKMLEKALEKFRKENLQR